MYWFWLINLYRVSGLDEPWWILRQMMEIGARHGDIDWYDVMAWAYEKEQ